MKKPHLLILLTVLLLGLLIPVIYWGSAGTNPNPQQGQKMTDIQTTTSSSEQVNSKEKTVAVPQEKVNSNSPATSNDVQNISPGVNPGDNAKATTGTMVAVAVVGKDEKLLFGPANVSLAVKDTHGLNALNALDATGLSYVMSTRYSDLVISVAGQQNQGQSGWMFKVNNEISSAAASQSPISQGDCVIWWYSKSLDTPSPDWESLSKSK